MQIVKSHTLTEATNHASTDQTLPLLNAGRVMDLEEDARSGNIIIEVNDGYWYMSKNKMG